MIPRRALIAFIVLFALGVALMVVLPVALRHPAAEPASALPAAAPAPSVSVSTPSPAGVYRSDDGGQTWQVMDRVGAGPTRVPAADATVFVVNSDDPNAVMLGTEAHGLWVSVDRGQSWGRVVGQAPGPQSAPLLGPSAHVLAIALAPARPREWYAAVFENNVSSVLATRDNGVSFSTAYAMPRSQIGIFDVAAISPEHLALVTGDGGLLASSDRGRTWRVVRWFRDGLIALEVNPVHPDERYALSAQGRLFRTENGGGEWTDLTARYAAATGSVEHIRMLVTSQGTLYLISSFGLLRSSDGGMTYHVLALPVSPGSLPVSALALSPLDPQRLVAAVGRGIYSSVDGGETWSLLPSPAGEGSAARIAALAFDPFRPKSIWAVVGLL